MYLRGFSAVSTISVGDRDRSLHVSCAVAAATDRIDTENNFAVWGLGLVDPPKVLDARVPSQMMPGCSEPVHGVQILSAEVE